MATDGWTIYHNPRCSKSRSTLALLRDKGIEPAVIEYLRTPPTRPQLKALVQCLGLKPEQLVRKGEDVYKQLYAGRAMTEEQWLDAMIEHPVLIERPIVVKGARAVIGRPPENALELL